MKTIPRQMISDRNWERLRRVAEEKTMGPPGFKRVTARDCAREAIAQYLSGYSVHGGSSRWGEVETDGAPAAVESKDSVRGTGRDG